MNDLSTTFKEKYENILENPIILIFLIPIIKKFLSQENRNILNLNFDHLSKNNFSKIFEKIDILVKVAPYLPKDFINIINKYLPIYDRISKAFIVMEFFQRTSTVSPVVVANDLNSKEKTNRVTYILKEELPQTEYQKISPFISMATNLDMYKGILKILTNINTSNNNSDSNNIDNLIDVIGPILANNNQKTETSEGKSPDINKLLGLLDLFNNDDESNSENQKEEDNKSKDKNIG
ncbi:hypothetical protein [Senegalia massiliensis]|uniref:Uncharacterized protein n=1 Tax=Senegalia massiliensis TaxID=1720316 RepID=A0A845QTE4_9CLOT|nr:hypothetical protein [Senegalia massiliensis]NBI05815.1 hypothetical protein [Senegalia massiliensis]